MPTWESTETAVVPGPTAAPRRRERAQPPGSAHSSSPRPRSEAAEAAQRCCQTQSPSTAQHRGVSTLSCVPGLFLQLPCAHVALPGAALRPQTRVPGRPATPARRRSRRKQCRRGGGGEGRDGGPQKPPPAPHRPPARSRQGGERRPRLSAAGRTGAERSAPLTAGTPRASPPPRPGSSAGESGARRHFVRPGGRAGAEGGRERGEGRGPGGGRATSCCPRPAPRELTRPAELTFPASSPAGRAGSLAPLLAGREGEGARTATCRAGEERGEEPPPPAPTFAVTWGTRPRARCFPAPPRAGTRPTGLRTRILPPPRPRRWRAVPRRGSHAEPNQRIHDAGGDLGVIRERHLRLMNGSWPLSALMRVSACS